jgi:hypothetical protein
VQSVVILGCVPEFVIVVESCELSMLCRVFVILGLCGPECCDCCIVLCGILVDSCDFRLLVRVFWTEL